MTTRTLERKGFPAGFKVADTGTVTATIATLTPEGSPIGPDSVDSFGDLTRPGFFGEQAVRMMWAHDTSRPVGRGRLFEDGPFAKFDGAFFMDTAAGVEAHGLVKAMGDLQEWSYGFNLRTGGFTLVAEQDRAKFGGARRVLHADADGGPGADIPEVSPVMVGAGRGTGTDAIKSQPRTFGEDIDAALAAVDAVLSRGRSLADLRAKDERRISTDTLTHVGRLVAKTDDLRSWWLGYSAEPVDLVIVDPRTVMRHRISTARSTQ